MGEKTSTGLTTMLLRESDRDIEQALMGRKSRSLAPLLSVTSHANLAGEPRWLVFCDYLALAMSRGTFGRASSDGVLLDMNEMAQQMWGADGLAHEELAKAWFSVEKKDSSGRVFFAEPEVIDRAMAVAALAGRRLNWECTHINPDALLQPHEQAALLAFWANRCSPKPAVHMPVMLVDGRAAFGEQGRRAQLRLTPVRVSAEQHGRLFRAPAAILLSLRTANEATFEEGLRKVQTLLQASLQPADPEGGWGLLWSLHPEPMVLDYGDSKKQRDWGTQAITGASATGAFALAALWVLREQLNDTLPGMMLARQQLRDIQPSQMTISAQLRGDAPPDPQNPFGWCWDPISGLDEKLGSFVLDRKLLSANESPVMLALVAGAQGYKGQVIAPVPVDTVAQALETAFRTIGAPLPEAAEALRRFLLDVPFDQARGDQGRLIEEAQPKTPVAPPALIQPLRSEAQRSSQQILEGPNRPEDMGKPNAIAWYLLRCYARWAGGDHMLWGEPARLAEDFYPIALETVVDEEEEATGPQTSGKKTAQQKTARSLIELLDTGFLPQQPPVWVLAASPAAGKTTMMAEYQLYHAFKALRQYALSGHFGVVPLWIPARQLVLQEPASGKLRTLNQAVAAWLQAEWPALGSLASLLSSAHARVQVLLDGINELRCDAGRRAQLLNDWVAAHFGSEHTHRPPLLTVRSLELMRPQGARVANLQPWSKGQRDAYVRQRLEGQPAQLQAMLAALEVDEKAAGGNGGGTGVVSASENMLYSNPGLLSLACTLMRQGLLPPDMEQRPMNRARLLSTLIWSRLEAEDPSHNAHVSVAMLGREEKKRLTNLAASLKEGHWHPPERPGLLLSALAEQARHMQFDHAAANIELPESQWWRDIQNDEERDALTQAAGHLGVLHSREGKDRTGRTRTWLGYRHQLLLEYFASLGLTPDGPWPANAAAPTMRPVEEDYGEWLARKKAWESRPHKEGEDGDENDDYQFWGDPVDWVERLIRKDNAPLAARMALENWTAFGEPLYPQHDPLGPWRPERKKSTTGGTHPVLNALRQALHQLMFDEQVPILSRFDAGNLLGALGGSPLFEICGQALKLKDKHCMPIGYPGEPNTYEMDDLEGYKKERTAVGRLISDKQVEHRWCRQLHQLSMEWFTGRLLSVKNFKNRWSRMLEQLYKEWVADYGLALEYLPRKEAAPVMDEEQMICNLWLKARSKWRDKQAEKQQQKATKTPEEFKHFQLHAAHLCDLEEPIMLAAQLRGNIEDWVSRLIAVCNAPLAARIALDNWAAFGEPLYPQDDPLGPWRLERKKGTTIGTHPVLNALRQVLHQRMYDEQVHLASRIEAGKLLGALGGSPLFEICGQALILKDEYWMPIGHPGEPYIFEMGDQDGYEDEITADDRLLLVSLRPFHMAGYLVTNAQSRCFVRSDSVGDAAWWLGESRHFLNNRECESQPPWNMGYLDVFDKSAGLDPAIFTFWQAQAYALWEQAQREQEGRSTGLRLQLPTEVQWEGAARWPLACQTQELDDRDEAQLSPSRWRFAHTAGVHAQMSADQDEEADCQGFIDVKPWHFNHNRIIPSVTSPVGVFLQSRTSHEGRALHDLAGNINEWCASIYRFDPDDLDVQKLNLELDQVFLDKSHSKRSLRGGNSTRAAYDCRVGTRECGESSLGDDFHGLRLVLSAQF